MEQEERIPTLTDTEDFCAKLVKKIPISVKKRRYPCFMMVGCLFYKVPEGGEILTPPRNAGDEQYASILLGS